MQNETDLLECNVNIPREFHVFEHSFEFGREGSSTLLLQLGQHALLCIHTGRLPNEQTFGQVLLVESLKDVLAVNESEYHHDFIQQTLHLLLSRFLVSQSKFRVHEFCYTKNKRLKHLDLDE